MIRGPITHGLGFATDVGQRGLVTWFRKSFGVVDQMIAAKCVMASFLTRRFVRGTVPRC